MDTPTKDDYKEVEPIDFPAGGFSTGLELHVCLSTTVTMTLPKKPFINATVFQAEVIAVGRAASHLLFADTKIKSVVIIYDSHAAIQALDNTKIKSITILDAVLALNKFWENDRVLIRWIPAQSVYVGNEQAETLAKRGANITDATLLKLPIPKATWNVAIRLWTKHNIWNKWRDAPPSYFTRDEGASSPSEFIT